ncbi:MAG TPA: tetratricopeptide repeat protein, partial [Dongiaceae bacterium]|nr:tetratricopeptide repeat protein [Dongiaceae bacterium]
STIVFPQALPLDVLLHVNVPGWLLANGFTDANGAARVLGVVEIALFAWLALRLARVLGTRGGAAFACVTTAFFGGYLCMFTGFGKAFAELCLLVAWTAVSGLDLVRRGRGAVSLGLAVAIAATLHRSGLGLVPAAAFAWVAGWRAHGAAPRTRRVLMLSLVAPVVSLAVMVPRIVAIVRQWDSVHFRPHEVVRAGGVLAATFAGTRAADILNLLVMLSPLVLVLLTVLPFVLVTRHVAPRPAIAPARRGARAAPATTSNRGAEPVFLALLALPFVAMMPFIHPAQGLFRDWDDFCATGVAISMLTAWTLAGLLRQRPARGWLAVTIAAGVAIPTLQWLEAQRDLTRGLARVRAFVAETPRRTDDERGKTWDFLGIRHVRLGNEAASAHRDDDAHRQYQTAADALSHAAETVPSPRILQEWGLAAALAGDYPTARDVYHRLLEKDPDNAYVRMSLAAVDMNLSDLAGAKTAGERVLALEPGNRDAHQLLHDIESVESGQARMP